MVKDELITRSPVRVFEKAINGGLNSGEIGLISAPVGMGKTSVLVQIALDKLLQGKKVIHISFTQEAHYVLSWYNDIFDEFIKKKQVENQKELVEDYVRNRVLLNFNQDCVTSDTIRKTLRALIVEGGYKAEAIIIDGFNFANVDRERFTSLRETAKELNLCIWYSCSAKEGDNNKKHIPNVIEKIEDCMDVIILLEQKGDHIGLYVVKNRTKYLNKEEPLRLDPKTLLMLSQ
jgi:hypothetical protein